MKLSFADIRRSLQIVDPFSYKHAIGVDIGTSSIKIVQLRKESGKLYLETYGEVDITNYVDDTGVLQHSNLPLNQTGNTLSELMHDILVSSSRAGVSIPASATLLFLIQLPTRDSEQVRRLVPSEAQKFIPMPVNEVLLDWLILPQDEPASFEHAFDKATKDHTASVIRQKVLIAAMQKEKIRQFANIMNVARLPVRFFEIETFSGARAALQHSSEVVLLIDLGASATKISVADRGFCKILRTTEIAGNTLTKTLVDAFAWDVAKAETVKHTVGIAPTTSTEEHVASTSSKLTPVLHSLVKEIELTIAKYQEIEKKDITRAILIGGGAKLPGIDTFLQEELHMPVEIARSFSHVSTPVVLEESLFDNGPAFANALGLAMRVLLAK